MPNIQFLHTGDGHIDSSTHGSLNPHTGLNRAWESHARCLSHLAEEAVERNVDFVIHAGDAFEMGRPTQEAINLFADCMMPVVDAGIPLVLFDGNHELLRVPTSFRTSTDTVGRMLSRYGEVHVVEEPKLLTLKSGMQIACLPWLSKTRTLAQLGVGNLDPAEGDAIVTRYALDELARMCDTADDTAPLILSSHITVDDLQLDHIASGHKRGSEVDLAHVFAEPILPWREVEKLPFSYGALAHIHAPQRVGNICHYAGSPDRLTFTDADDDKGGNFVTVTESNQLVAVDRVLTPARKMQRIDLATPQSEQQITEMAPDTLVKLTTIPGATAVPDEVREALHESGAVLADTRFVPIPEDRPEPLSISRDLDVLAATREWLAAHCPDDIDPEEVLATVTAMTAGEVPREDS